MKYFNKVLTIVTLSVLSLTATAASVQCIGNMVYTIENGSVIEMSSELIITIPVPISILVASEEAANLEIIGKVKHKGAEFAISKSDFGLLLVAGVETDGNLMQVTHGGLCSLQL